MTTRILQRKTNDSIVHAKATIYDREGKSYLLLYIQIRSGLISATLKAKPHRIKTGDADVFGCYFDPPFPVNPLAEKYKEKTRLRERLYDYWDKS